MVVADVVAQAARDAVEEMRAPAAGPWPSPRMCRTSPRSSRW